MSSSDVRKGGRQSREQLFKERPTSKREIRTFWKEVGEASSKRGENRDPGGRASYRWRSRRGFGYHVGEARARSNNTAVQDLLGNEGFTPALLRLLSTTTGACQGEGSQR